MLKWTMISELATSDQSSKSLAQFWRELISKQTILIVWQLNRNWHFWLAESRNKNFPINNLTKKKQKEEIA